jgi:membrane associated rhomboid family serine protease
MVFPVRVTQRSYSTPVVTATLIAVNVAVFLHQFLLDPFSLNHFIASYALRPYAFQPLNLLTHMFLHGGWVHLIGNMLFLWVFGENVEDILGHAKFLGFYLLCGVLAALVQFAADPISRVPMVGASGAIAGVMGAYLVRFPRSRVEMIFFAILLFHFTVPAWFMLAYWFLLQVLGSYNNLSEASQGGTAFFAHVGGFVAGIALIRLMGARQRFSRRRDLYW